MNESTISVNKKRKAWNNLQRIVKNTKVDLPKDYNYKEEYKNVKGFKSKILVKIIDQASARAGAFLCGKIVTYDLL